MVYSADRAVQNALASTTNTPGSCQRWTREQYGAPSAGDQDHDGDADAVDGWLSEPSKYRHTDRHPPRGAPVAFHGGSSGYGHRAISLGTGQIRSTDMSSSSYSRGHVGTTTIDQIELHMGVHYTGWSESIDGYLIPGLSTNDRPDTEQEDDVSAKDVWAEEFAKWAPDATPNQGDKIDAAMQLNQARGYAEDAYDRIKKVEADVAKLMKHFGIK
jgi:hypothetical protein